MTTEKEEILAMEPGGELDVLVVRKIFGLEVEGDYEWEDIKYQGPKLPFIKGEPRTVLGPMAHPANNTIFNYSTDIAAAWQVVEKMIEGDRYFGLQRVVNDNEWLWEVTAYGPVWVIAADAPEAICKAALLAELEL